MTGASPFRAPDVTGRPSWGHALAILSDGLAAVDGGAAVRRAVELSGERLTLAGEAVDLGAVQRVFVVAAGKAAAPMVRALEEILGSRIATGVGVTVAEAAGTTAHTTLHAGGHPIPDPGSLMAARRIAGLLEDAGTDDLVILLLSGGASALLEMPVQGVQLADLQSTTSVLLGSGATINEMNAVRKHLSRVKGGRLAELAAPARVITLVISDVVGSPLDVIGSGPTVPDTTTYGDAAEVVARFGLWGRLPGPVGDALRAGAAGRVAETPKPGDPVFERTTTRVIASNADACAAACTAAERLGYAARLLTTWLEGEAREVGRVLAALGKEAAGHGEQPACLVAGGETTVTLRHLGGKGGRNQELALAGALALEEWPTVVLAACGTDGIHGATTAAGAIVDGTTAARARALGLDPRAALERHDSGPFFGLLGDALVTGPTGTNVNDLNVILAGAP